MGKYNTFFVAIAVTALILGVFNRLQESNYRFEERKKAYYACLEFNKEVLKSKGEKGEIRIVSLLQCSEPR